MIYYNEVLAQFTHWQSPFQFQNLTGDNIQTENEGMGQCLTHLCIHNN